MGNALARVNGQLYEVLGPLGEGGFAHVYEVKRDGRHFALKWTRGVTEGEDLERLLLEIQVQRQLQHPNVLPLEAAEVRRCQESNVHIHVEKEALMVFPLAGRGSLQTALEQAACRGSAVFTEAQCLHFFAKLVDAVAALHELGYAHRDLKPGNILLSDGDPVEPLLMDFGSVAPVRMQLKGRKLWEDAARYSSAPYRAPELWDTSVGGDTVNVVDGRTDVWSLGCVLYAMAFGPYSPFEHPRDGVQQLGIINGYVNFPHGNMHLGQVFSATFTALIRWILTPDVAERPKLEGVCLCIDQLLHPAPRKQPSRRLSVRKHRLSAAEVTKPTREPSMGETDWADFSAFQEAHSMSSELSFSMAVRSRSTSLVSKLPLASRSSSTRMLSVKQTSASSIVGGATSSDGSRNRGLSDPNRRRALSRTGKQLWVSALEAQISK
ncbi:unnamed protein product [Phytophthora lilii]|uniref:non-specific serine/threonine protein kinase n=1 Tax=Phytophthora lilii TaxID=2077276 RepID=A0A9W6TBG0_9STRA|nr:unnamed protein product [Phytophthora lilii]